jgi:hypothetical protein
LQKNGRKQRKESQKTTLAEAENESREKKKRTMAKTVAWREKCVEKNLGKRRRNEMFKKKFRKKLSEKNTSAA